MYIAIAGNIGCGRADLIRLIKERLGWYTCDDSNEVNPYLDDFTNNIYRWSFSSQLWYLGQHYRETQRLLWHDGVVVQPRTMMEDMYIYAYNLYAMGAMDQRDFETYTRVFENYHNSVSQPDIILYLRASVPTLLERILDGQSKYESNLDSNYIMRLNERYEEWIQNYKGDVLVIDVDSRDCFTDETNIEALLTVLRNVVKEHDRTKYNPR
ncbi:MAG: deoxynucleoside kinase [Bacteroidales bacterium]|nr:deoxynucleoside kinase [Bacteroidales bacterium]